MARGLLLLVTVDWLLSVLYQCEQVAQVAVKVQSVPVGFVVEKRRVCRVCLAICESISRRHSHFQMHGVRRPRTLELAAIRRQAIEFIAD